MAYLVYFIDKARQEHQLSQVDTSIGRDDGCTIQIHADPEVSRLHCTVQRREDGTFIVIDAASRNGTYLNGQKVMDGAPPLTDGDLIRVGHTHLRFFDPPPDEGPRTERIFAETEQDMADGKGFHTIMEEITR